MAIAPTRMAVGVSCVALLTTLFSISALFLDALEPERPVIARDRRKPHPEDAVADLLNQLETGDAKAKAVAYTRLRELGPIVLDVLPRLHYGKTSETRRRVLDLMDEIRREHDTPIPSQPLEFAIATDPVWLLPERGKSCNVKIEVLILGRGDIGLRCYLLDTMCLEFVGPDGNSLPARGGRNQTGGPYPWTSPLKRGDLYVFDHIHAKLDREASDGSLSVHWKDGFGGSLYATGLKRGINRIHLSVYHDRKNSVDKLPDGTRPWHGAGSALPVTVYIH